MKLTFEDKIEIIRLYEDEQIGSKELSSKFKISESVIKLLIKKYKQHGIKELMHPSKKKTYTAEFKMMIIKEVYNGVSKTSLAAKYNLPGPGTIVSWMKKYDELGYNGLISKKRGRPKKIMSPKETNTETNEINDSISLTDSERTEYEELKKKYELLKKEKEQSDMEVDLLKKLNALVQQRKKQQRKKK